MADGFYNVQVAFVNEVMALRARGLTREQILATLSQLDIKEHMLTNLGLRGDIEEFMLTYETMLLGMEKYAEISPITLQALKKADTAFFMNALTTQVSEVLKGELQRAAITGVGQSGIIANLAARTTLRKDHIRTLANSAVRQYSRNVTAEMSNAMPADAKYVYMGVVDEITRPICLQMVAAGARTKKQIETQFKGAFNTAGGYNCRHRWTLATETAHKLNPSGKAKSWIKNYEKKTGRRWVTPQTPLEQVAARA